MKVLRGHKGDIHSVIFFDDMIASTGYDKTIKIWNNTTGILIRTLIGHTSIIKTLTSGLYHNISLIISGSWDNTIRIWDSQTGECKNILIGHNNRVKAVITTIIDNILYILSTSDDCTIKLWDIEGNILCTFIGHNQPVISIAVSNSLIDTTKYSK